MNDVPFHFTDTRVAIQYRTKGALERAKALLCKRLRLPVDATKIINPNDENMGTKLEGKSEKIGKTLLHLHFKFGAIGLIAGMILAFLLVSFGPDYTQLNPVFTYIALISPGLFIGLFAAGLVSLKPEHDSVNLSAVKGKAENNWTLIVDTTNTNISKQAVVEEIESTDPVSIQS